MKESPLEKIVDCTSTEYSASVERELQGVCPYKFLQMGKKFVELVPSLILFTVLGLSVYALFSNKFSNEENYQTGTVEKEYGTITQIGESGRALFENESVKSREDLTYILQIKTDEGKYTASVVDRFRTIEELAIAIEEGDRVRFLFKDTMDAPISVGSHRVGRIYANQIEILPKE